MSTLHKMKKELRNRFVDKAEAEMRLQRSLVKKAQRSDAQRDRQADNETLEQVTGSATES